MASVACIQQAEGYLKEYDVISAMLGNTSHPVLTEIAGTIGFYTIDMKAPMDKPSLILGPFHGKVACQTIAFGRGVCGAAALTKKVQLVPDVDQFPGHIACDGASKSEIVVPIVVNRGESASEQLVAIIDIDCAVAQGFDEMDQDFLEQLANMLADGCDWP